MLKCLARKGGDEWRKVFMGVAGGMSPAVFKLRTPLNPPLLGGIKGDVSLPVARGNWPENALHFPGVKMPRVEARGDSLL